MNNTLESLRIFPYIAWSLVIGFALFTYTLTLHLKEELSSISTGIERLEQKIDTLETKKPQ